jgi:fumarate reductase subunit C
MNGPARYTEHHPRWYRERVSTYWWLWRWRYLRFVLRELSSVAVAYFVAVTLLQIRALLRGPEAYATFTERLGSPLLLALSAVSFLFVLYHAVTWFHLAPAAMVVRLRGRRVPAWAIVASNYAAWLAASAAVAWLVLRG